MKKYIVILLGMLMAFGLVACKGKEESEYLTTGYEQLEKLEYVAAESSFRQAADAKENQTECYRGLGISLMGQNRYEEAVDCFTTALKESGSKPSEIDYDINYYLGVCYHKLGEYEKAKERYDAILVLKPKETDAYMQRATENLYLKDIEAAQADFEKAISLEKKNYKLYIDIYNLMAETGYQSIGTQYLEKALEKDDKNMSDFDKGYINYCLGNYPTAKNYLESARSDGNKSGELLLLLGRCYEELNETAYAIEQYRKYAENTPDASVYNQLAAALISEERYDEAIDACVAGLEVDSNECRQQLLYNRIVAYEYLGDFDKAKELAAQYVVDYPSDETMAREYKFLETR